MGLSNASRDYLGKLLRAKPFYGWGWCRLNPEEPQFSYQEAAGPAEFRMRILGFFEHQGELRGAKAKIEEPGHLADGWFAVFSTRQKGDFDFEARVPHCNISIGPELEEAVWPKISGVGALAGFAEVKKEEPIQHPQRNALDLT